MRLAWKFTISFVASLCIVLAAYGMFLSKHEVDRLKRDTQQDQLLLGHILALSMRHEWESAGQAAAMDLIRQANQDQGQTASIRWIWLSDPPPAGMPHEYWAELQKGREITWVDEATSRSGYLCTFTPLPLSDGRVGALEIREPLELEMAHIRKAVRGVIAATVTMAGISAVISVVLGIKMVGRPVRELIGQAREVASGHFDQRLAFHQRDELGQLADEFNRMCEQLAAARDRVAAETAARLKTMEQLRHADRLKTVGQLASGIAHELGTPLNVVRARAKMIASDSSCPADLSSNARIVVEQSDRMARIIRQLLDFARPRLPRRVPTELRMVLQQTINLLESIAEKRNLRMSLSTAEEGLSALVDPDQMQQVFSNLMLNGIHAMPDGGILEIRISSERLDPPAEADIRGPEHEYVRIDVEDHGQGIDPEHMERIFEPFFTTKQIGEGTGLGLSVSRGIIKEHGGWIAVISRVGQGSCFSVYLPRKDQQCLATS